MVYSIGALLLPDKQELANRLYASALLYTDFLSGNNLEATQGLLCFAMYALRSQEGPSLWKLSGLALRQCIELGYHRRSNQTRSLPNVLQLEMRKRVFWCAQGIDCSYALRLGRPLGIQPFEIDAELPLDVDDEAITDAGLHGSPRTLPDQEPTSMSNAIHVIRLRQIWARMHASVYSANTLGEVDSDSRRRQITQLRDDLEKEWFELNYSGTILLLYRGQLAEDKGTANDIFMDCVQAASTVCHIYRRLAAQRSN
ncbi:hypothetical protein KJ359_001757 [Pestalotiopsis sp. 9143b]|nr:hypothetical protein KJ359_001757 [Pestalotiopsis sp. 9143b]